VSEPIVTTDGATIVKVLERQDVEGVGHGGLARVGAAGPAGRAPERVLHRYMVKARQRMKIELNREVLNSILG